jgi:class 3 adenylate cyclase
MSSERQRRKQRSKLSEAIGRQVYEQVLESVSTKRKLPDGIVSIVFTDVEGSTALVRDLGEQRARAHLRRHDEIVRELTEAHAGTVVERAGDSFMLVFRTASQAVTFAIELHDRLAAEPWDDREVRVRIGIDTGEVITEEKGYFGSTVVRAARIADLARAGEVLVSDTTRLIAAGAAAAFVEAGQHDLKGLPGPHALFAATPGPSALPA